MTTVVLQSFRTHDVPPWLQACLRSVQRWATGQGWQHRFMDDRFFTLAPDWVHQRCGHNLYAVTDICRLLWARAALAEGVERVLWVDADVLVFDPPALALPAGIGHGLARELFLCVERDGSSRPVHGVNNALMVFERGDALLDTYLQASLDCLRTLPDGPVPRTALGPALLQSLGAQQDLQLVERVGLFTGALMADIAAGGGALSQRYLQLCGQPPAAANLCHFQRNATPPPQRPGFDALYRRAVERLLQHGSAALAQASVR